MAVDDLGDLSALVADQERDLDADPVSTEQRDEAVPQLARRPVLAVQPRSQGNYSSELPPDVGRVQVGADAGGEDQVVMLPLLTGKLLGRSPAVPRARSGPPHSALRGAVSGAISSSSCRGHRGLNARHQSMTAEADRRAVRP